MVAKIFKIFLILIFLISQGFAQEITEQKLAENERLLVILGTNDLHGALDTTTDKFGNVLGGMSFWSGVVKATREGLNSKYGSRAGLVLLDGGDQFQGTLLSNYNEGVLMASAMNVVGYDAAVPGNHDYDFGPIGWLEDQVTPQSKDQDKRGAFKRVIEHAKFPFLSANTYLKDSLVDEAGNRVNVNAIKCESTSKIQWSKAKRLDFFKPYIIKEVAGVRVALIGLDHHKTSTVTMEKNVTDLCFRDEVETYLEVRNQLEGKADVFVIVMHNGNSQNEFEANDIVRAINIKTARADALDNTARADALDKTARADALDDSQKVHAVVAGHTHQINNTMVLNTPIIQSSTGGKMFGRIELVWDSVQKVVVQSKTRHFAGVSLFHKKCAPAAERFCTQDPTTGALSYEGQSVEPDSKIEKLVSTAKQELAPVSERVLGNAKETIKKDRIQESALANVMTDALRAISKTDVAFLNAGGIRTEIPAGKITYDIFFKVFPFNNRSVVIGPMGIETLLNILKKTVTTCGAFGTLVQSGLKVQFERKCENVERGDASGSGGFPNDKSIPDRVKDGLDTLARLLRVETIKGELLYDQKTVVPQDYTVNVATVDFLAQGGEKFEDFKSAPMIQDLGIMREVLVEEFLRTPVELTNQTDGRWKEIAPVR